MIHLLHSGTPGARTKQLKSLVHTCAMSITQANISDISIRICTRKKEHVLFFLVHMLMLMSLVLCLSHKCEPGWSTKHTTEKKIPDEPLSIGNQMISSAIWNTEINYNRLQKISRARRASAICSLWKIYDCLFISNCTRKIVWLHVNNVQVTIFVTL